MKKIIALFSVFTLVLSSCSKDDVVSEVLTSPVVSYVLPTKIIETNSTGQVSTSLITYNGNKLVQIITGEDKSVFTYTGDFITKVEDFSSGNNIEGNTIYTYENNKLKTLISTEYSATTTYKNKYVFTHNTNGTVDFLKYNVNAANVETLSGSGKYTFLNGNLVKEEDGLMVAVYEYDAKNNPRKNILGFDKLLDDEQASINNKTKVTRTYNSGTPTVRVYQFDYNAVGYPTEERELNSSDVVVGKVQYFY
ncbi:hypothetical protein [Flavobacterium facile]|uniref:hypothetical protein n=1 Tax=Flavobacterium facile TaxID=2893174 RepID=UPI002E786C00|nr:hypothetical protein [Flavobacterium sp. T-12]